MLYIYGVMMFWLLCLCDCELLIMMYSLLWTVLLFVKCGVLMHVCVIDVLFGIECLIFKFILV